MNFAVTHVPKRKRTGNLVLADYPDNIDPPVVSLFDYAASQSLASSDSSTTGSTIEQTCSMATVSRPCCPSPQLSSDLEIPDKNPTSSSTLAWAFLSHPSLRLLRKWPGLYAEAKVAIPTELPTSRRQPVPHSPATEVPSENDAVTFKPPPVAPLKLLSLLDIPPIASSLASHLYGHDLLNLRLLNSGFFNLLSSRKSPTSKRPYFHTLLLKSLLCSRSDTISEPTGFPCISSGGNVGPCSLCSTILCSVFTPYPPSLPG